MQLSLAGYFLAGLGGLELDVSPIAATGRRNEEWNDEWNDEGSQTRMIVLKMFPRQVRIITCNVTPRYCAVLKG